MPTEQPYIIRPPFIQNALSPYAKMVHPALNKLRFFWNYSLIMVTADSPAPQKRAVETCARYLGAHVFGLLLAPSLPRKNRIG
jgi:hypothetical protein